MNSIKINLLKLNYIIALIYNFNKKHHLKNKIFEKGWKKIIFQFWKPIDWESVD